MENVMATLAQRILGVVLEQPGITDRLLAEALFGAGTPQQRVNGECRLMETRGLLRRAARSDGLKGNYLVANNPLPSALPSVPEPSLAIDTAELSEDRVKVLLQMWLRDQGWAVEIAWAKTPGIDIHAQRGDQRWIIEAKGSGSLNPMRVNYFLGVLGETLQRMNDPRANYSIALPDLRQFRNLWERLPRLAKERTGITALFVGPDGTIEHVGVHDSDLA
jgi:hypothetical protein